MSKTDPKDKLAMVLDATEHPEQYTDEQLEELLRDEECAAYYRLMSEASSAFAETHTESEEEIDAEWQRIADRHKSRLILRKVAAIIIAVIVMSGISYAAVRLMQSRHQPVPEPIPTAIQTAENQTAPITETDDSLHTFQNAELQDILTAVSAHYQLHTEYHSGEARHIRLYIKWNKNESVDSMLQRLNKFEKVNLTLSGNHILVE
jgi:hypothetical protein